MNDRLANEIFKEIQRSIKNSYSLESTEELIHDLETAPDQFSQKFWLLQSPARDHFLNKNKYSHANKGNIVDAGVITFRAACGLLKTINKIADLDQRTNLIKQILPHIVHYGWSTLCQAIHLKPEIVENVFAEIDKIAVLDQRQEILIQIVSQTNNHGLNLVMLATMVNPNSLALSIILQTIKKTVNSTLYPSFLAYLLQQQEHRWNFTALTIAARFHPQASGFGLILAAIDEFDPLQRDALLTAILLSKLRDADNSNILMYVVHAHPEVLNRLLSAIEKIANLSDKKKILKILMRANIAKDYNALSISLTMNPESSISLLYAMITLDRTDQIFILETAKLDLVGLNRLFERFLREVDFDTQLAGKLQVIMSHFSHKSPVGTMKECIGILKKKKKEIPFTEALGQQTLDTAKTICKLILAPTKAKEIEDPLVKALIARWFIACGAKLKDGKLISDKAWAKLLLCMQQFERLKIDPDNQDQLLFFLDLLSSAALELNSQQQVLIWSLLEQVKQQYSQHLAINILYFAYSKTIPHHSELSLNFYLPSLNKLLIAPDTFSFDEIILRPPNPIDAALVQAAILEIVNDIEQFIHNYFDKNSSQYLSLQQHYNLSISPLKDCLTQTDLLQQLELIRLYNNKYDVLFYQYFKKERQLISAKQALAQHQPPAANASLALAISDHLSSINAEPTSEIITAQVGFSPLQPNFQGDLDSSNGKNLASEQSTTVAELIEGTTQYAPPTPIEVVPTRQIPVQQADLSHTITAIESETKTEKVLAQQAKNQVDPIKLKDSQLKRDESTDKKDGSVAADRDTVQTSLYKARRSKKQQLAS